MPFYKATIGLILSFDIQVDESKTAQSYIIPIKENNMATFLTNEWFEQVEQMGNEAGELNLPPALANMIVNLKVSDAEQDIEANFANGLLHRGLNEAATTTLLLDRDILQSIITDFDTNQIMGAFMSGKIRVEGDMSQLMAVQTARPSAEQKELYRRIKSMTTMA